MTRARLIITWLLLLVPTLLLGIGALYLLKGEEARLADSARGAAGDRVAAIAGSLDLAIAEVRDGLMETLRGLPPGESAGRADLLEEWKRGNPLVRNVFVWEPGRGLRHPDPERPASDEDAAFVRRYLPLFTGQVAWQEPAGDAAAPRAPSPASSVLAERRVLRELAKQAPQSAESAGPAAPAGAGGWRPWFADDSLHLLGWYEPAGAAQRLGVEVEMMALLSRLLGAFPADPPDGESYALHDGNGAVFHQVGPLEITAGARPLVVAAIAGLPHWTVAAYSGSAATGTAGGFRLVAGLLVGTFVVAILLGGSLLLWQAHRDQRDARQKTSFVSSVSHELKTPLTTIRMYAELLGEGRIADPARQRSYLETIIRESQRLTRLVNNVLDFSRLEQGRREFAKDEIDLAALLHRLLDDQLVRLEEAGMQLERRVAAGPASLRGDRDAIEQIVLNLLDNAIKYAAAGRDLQVVLQPSGAGWQVSVCDRGPGIPPAHRRQVFDKFHRVDASLTARQQGSGLGLSIARQLAEGVGGSLEFRPREGGGACFELNLPGGGNR